MRRRHLAGVLVVGLVGALAAGCTYMVGDLADLAPSPVGVSVERLPEILAARADFVMAGFRDLYETRCGRIWDPDEEIWRWRCWSVWVGRNVWGDVVITLDVDDPSGDLDPSKSPQVHLAGALPSGQGCALSVPASALSIGPGDVIGSGAAKTVRVRVPNLTVRFTPSCRVLSGVLPLVLVFRDCGTTMTSVNTVQAVITIPR